MSKNQTYTHTTGVHRPTPSTLKPVQGLIIIGDNSPSMLQQQKAEQAFGAISNLIRLLAEPINQDGFYTGVVYFSKYAEVAHDMTKASEILDHVNPFFHDLYKVGHTNITDGIAIATKLVDSFNANKPVTDGHYLPHIVALFSDGMHNVGKGPGEAAQILKRIATLVTVSFGDDADVEEMKRLASSEQHYRHCATGSQLREYFYEIGSVLRQTRIAGIDATQALTQIQ